MKEQQVADMLGVTQSAISKYSKNVRGTTIPLDKIPEVQTIANQMITILLTRPAEYNELMKLFCQACTIIRCKGLMCAICQENQKPKIDNCDFCDEK